jgi:opacity protein-like surface antigen
VRVFGACALAILLAAPSGARAQSWEMTGLLGHTSKASLDNQAPELSGLDVRGGLTWGLQLTRFFASHWGAEVSFIRQSSALQLETSGASADLFDMAVGQLHGSIVRQFGGSESRLRPFLSAGVGASFLSGDDLESETKLSFSLGAGVKYFPWKTVGFLGKFRYKPTLLKDEDPGRYCDPFGFCQGTLQQMDVLAGVTVRF